MTITENPASRWLRRSVFVRLVPQGGGVMMSDKEAWKEQCRENARILETEINRLQSDYIDPLGFWRRYRDFWAHAKRISAMFKTPLLREDRERLWAAYSA